MPETWRIYRAWTLPSRFEQWTVNLFCWQNSNNSFIFGKVDNWSLCKQISGLIAAFLIEYYQSSAFCRSLDCNDLNDSNWKGLAVIPLLLVFCIITVRCRLVGLIWEFALILTHLVLCCPFQNHYYGWLLLSTVSMAWFCIEWPSPFFAITLGVFQS